MSSSSVTPPPSIPIPTTPATAATPAVVSVPQAPVELILLPRGTPVEARVVALPPVEGGLATLQAVVDGARVEIAARLPLPLPVGADLSLRVAPTQAGDAVTLRLGAVAPEVPAPSHLATEAARAAQPAAAISTIGVGKPVAALVLRGDAIPDHPKGAELLAPGTRLTVRLTQIVLPTPQAGQLSPSGPAAPTQASAQPALPSAPPPAGQAAARYAAIDRIGQPAQVPIPANAPQGQPPAGPAAPGLAAPPPPAGAVAAPGIAAAATPAAPAGGSPAAAPGAAPLPPGEKSVVADPPAPGKMALSGAVIGRSTLGQPVLKTDAGVVALDLRAAFPVGTRVAAEVLASRPPLPGAPPPAAFSGASAWTTLDALTQALATVDPQAAQRIVAALPQPGPQMLAHLAGAMAAVRTGDAGGWQRLADALQRAREEPRAAKLAGRFADDLREASAAAQRPQGEWRVYPLPMFAGGGIERIQMLVRRTPEQQEEGENPANPKRRDDTRFVLDFTLSHLGPMQIDGLVSATARSLDLVIRTHDPLPPEMAHDLRGIFSTAMAAAGYAGGLSLMATPEFAVPEIARPDDRPGVVV